MPDLPGAPIHIRSRVRSGDRRSASQDPARGHRRPHDLGAWLTLQEIETETGYSTASISAQLRHLRKKQFGSNIVEKRRRPHRDGSVGGTWEYMVKPKRYDAEGL